MKSFGCLTKRGKTSPLIVNLFLRLDHLHISKLTSTQKLFPWCARFCTFVCTRIALLVFICITSISYASEGLKKIFDSSHGLPGTTLQPWEWEPWVTRLLSKTANTLLDIAAVVSVIAICIVGYMYITSFGKEENTSTAKKYLLVIVTGILLALCAWAMISLVDLIPTSVKF